MTERVIRVSLETGPAEASAKKLGNELERTGDKGRKASSNINKGFTDVTRTARGFRRAVTGLFALTGVGLGARELVGLADAYTQIQNRLRVVTTGTAQLSSVTNELFEIAQRTRSSFESTAELYSRVALASRDLGISQQQTTEFTESLNQAVILSGASTQEASAGILQLSQGLASGSLRGDELRSVLEQLPVVADVIADSLGVTRGELRELGTEGKISAQDVLRGFREAREELAERFGRTIPTLSQSFQQLRNQIVSTVGQFNEASGAGGFFSEIIQSVTKGIRDATPQMVAFGKAISGTLEPTDKVVDSTKSLSLIFISASTSAGIFANSLITTVGFALRQIGRTLGGIGASLVALYEGDFERAGDIAKLVVTDISDDFTETFSELNEEIVSSVTTSLQKINELNNASIRTVQPAQEEEVTQTRDRGVGRVTAEQRELSRATQERNTILLEQIELLDQEEEILGEVGAQRDILLNQLAIEQELRSSLGDKAKNLTQEQITSLVSLTETEREVFAAQVQTNFELARRAELLQEIRSPQEELINTQKDLNVLFQDGEISAKEFTSSLEELTFAQAELNNELGNASFEEGFLLALENTLEAAKNWRAEVGGIFGSLFDQVTDGFADAAANAIIYGESFEEAFGNAARNALQQLISGLIKLGIQFLINQTLGQTAISTTAATQVAANASITASATPAAATTSLASFGANAAPAIAGILAVGAAAAALGAFETGGSFKVGGSGGNDSQLVMFRASPEETVNIQTPQQRDRTDNKLSSSSSGEATTVSGPTVINVLDPALLNDALATSGGKNALVNVISRNANEFNAALGNS